MGIQLSTILRLWERIKIATDRMDVFKHMSEDRYASLVQNAFGTVLSGILPKILACVFLLLALWVGAYRRQVGLGIIFFILAIIFAYMPGLIKLGLQ